MLSYDPDSPAVPCASRFQGGWLADHLVQGIDNLLKLGPLNPFFLPAVQHQQVQDCGAVRGRWQAIVLINRIDDL